MQAKRKPMDTTSVLKLCVLGLVSLGVAASATERPAYMQTGSPPTSATSPRMLA